MVNKRNVVVDNKKLTGVNEKVTDCLHTGDLFRVSYLKMKSLDHIAFYFTFRLTYRDIAALLAWCHHYVFAEHPLR